MTTYSAPKQKITYSIWQYAAAGIGLGRLLDQLYHWAIHGFTLPSFSTLSLLSNKSLALVICLLMLLIFAAILIAGSSND